MTTEKSPPRASTPDRPEDSAADSPVNAGPKGAHEPARSQPEAASTDAGKSSSRDADDVAPKGSGSQADEEDASSIGADGFTRHMHRRKVANYERSLARSAYAYGVDLRRSTWLASSSVGEIMLRSLDRRWPKLAQELVSTSLRSLRSGESLSLLRELERTVGLLRAPSPTLWLLREDAPDRMQWPIVTALGAQHGDIRWLIVDEQRLAALTPGESRFDLAAGVSHLQNDHGALLCAHFLAHREGTLRRLSLRAGLYPWSQVMAFSSDRAGLIRLGALAPALLALRRTVIAEGVCPWYPQTASLALRERALEEFAKTDVFARLCAARRSLTTSAAGATDLSPEPGRDAVANDDLVLDDLVAQGASPRATAGASRAKPARSAGNAAEPDAAAESSPHASSDGVAEAGAEERSARQDAASSPPPGPRALIPEDAWPLARADNRLTARLRVY